MIKAKNKTGLVFFPAFDWAIDSTHPEREERLLYTQDQVFEEGILDIEGIVEYKAKLAKEEDIKRVHFCYPNVKSVATESHLISAGSAIEIGRAVLKKEIKKGFALVRPPGHHSMRVTYGCRGFCNINIEAIMIEHLRKHFNIKKVAIVDTDCHHGDGTQDIYWNDKDTLFISLHQDGRTLYPGSGFQDELGGINAIGNTINIPLPPGTSDEGYLFTIEEAVLPILQDFKPDLIINSAGQDNHYTDPITNMCFSAQGYAKLTSLLNPDIAVLEGGYSIEGALPYVNAGIILSMAGLDYSYVKEPSYNAKSIRQSEETFKQIKKICKQALTIWEKKESIQDELKKGKEFTVRQKHINYDTDGIYERQTETLKVCKDCSGTFKIETAIEDRGVKNLLIHIPRDACPKCIEIAKEWQEKAPNIFDNVYFQDVSKI